jgi:DNA (cytosine-5)-methyltransferase 1
VNVLDLFSGIGGFSLGLERAGMRTVAFCEIDPYARAVLRKHWPDVPCYDDVRTVTADRLRADGIACDVICGGFPCQDISHAGKGAGLAGERSGLWSEIARLVGELRPRYVIVENVSALLGRGLDRVLGDLAEIGYDAEWHCIPASYVGARHIRDRVWIIAHPDRLRELQPQGNEQDIGRRDHFRPESDASHAHRSGLQERFLRPGVSPGQGRHDDGQDTAVDPWWPAEPALVRRFHGIPNRVDRIRCLGNAVVPQVVEVIGRAIMAADMQRLRNDEREFRSKSDERLIAPFNAVTVK